jgi:histone H3/H4
MAPRKSAKPALAASTIKRVVKSADSSARTAPFAAEGLLEHANKYLDALASATAVMVKAKKQKTVSVDTLQAVLAQPIHGWKAPSAAVLAGSSKAVASHDSKGKEHRGITLSYVKDRVAKSHGFNCGDKATLVIQNAVHAYLEAVIERALTYTHNAKRVTMSVADLAEGAKSLC